MMHKTIKEQWVTGKSRDFQCSIEFGSNRAATTEQSNRVRNRTSFLVLLIVRGMTIISCSKIGMIPRQVTSAKIKNS